MTSAFAAVDIGASGGRVVTGVVGGGRVRLEESHRFPNVPARVGGSLTWDVASLLAGALEGLRIAGESHPLDSIGVDGWAVDYGLLDQSGTLIGNPVHYRDERTAGAVPRVQDVIPPAELYARTGIQFLPFNTVYQLASELESPQFRAARTLLLVPDLLVYWLTDHVGAERTNASTTQLLDVRSGEWATDLMRRIGIPPELFPPLVDAGEARGEVLPALFERAGLHQPVPVVTVGSHDTASAVVAVPARDRSFAYVATGTWSLVGVELVQPILTEESRAANFTNELGVDGTVRYLRNVMGLWLLQQSMSTWEAAGYGLSIEDLLAGAAAAEPLAAVVDVDDSAFIAPGNMPERIANACRLTGQRPPEDPATTVRCILDSLALGHARAIADAVRLSGHEVEVVHVVGGGTRNSLLCQLTADACDLPVEAGPVEAAALGNVLVQARAAGALHGGLTALRKVARETEAIRRYEPSGNPSQWQAAAQRIR